MNSYCAQFVTAPPVCGNEGGLNSFVLPPKGRSSFRGDDGGLKPRHHGRRSEDLRGAGPYQLIRPRIFDEQEHHRPGESSILQKEPASVKHDDRVVFGGGIFRQEQQQRQQQQQQQPQQQHQQHQQQQQQQQHPQQQQEQQQAAAPGQILPGNPLPGSHTVPHPQQQEQQQPQQQIEVVASVDSLSGGTTVGKDGKQMPATIEHGKKGGENTTQPAGFELQEHQPLKIFGGNPADCQPASGGCGTITTGGQFLGGAGYRCIKGRPIGADMQHQKPASSSNTAPYQSPLHPPPPIPGSAKWAERKASTAYSYYQRWENRDLWHPTYGLYRKWTKREWYNWYLNDEC